MNKGNLITLKIQESKQVNDTEALKIFGVRFAKFLPNGWVHFDQMTPSKKLLFKFKDKEKNGNWNQDAFDSFYKPNFLKETSCNDLAKEEIKKIAQHLKQGKNVYYACYCKEFSLCHRSIIAEIFERNGYNVLKN